MKSDIIIAIDGYSSCGKSTLAKELAQKLGYTYIDTGAMYRAVTLYLLELGIPIEESAVLQAALADIHISFQTIEGKRHTFLNGKSVEEEIRGMKVAQHVSEVATLSSVRKKLVEQQQQMGAQKGVVLEGRDIGTVVFPAAELKIFLTAHPRERAKRRLKELEAKGEQTTYDEVLDNLLHRDKIDSTRADSPLRKADDAIVIVNTYITPEQQLGIAMKLVEETMEAL